MKTLYYYKDSNDKYPLGFVPLWECSVDPSEDRESDYCFEISHPDRRTFFLKASSEEEMQDWLEALTKIIDTGRMEQKVRRELFWMTHFGPEKREVTWEEFFK